MLSYGLAKCYLAKPKSRFSKSTFLSAGATGHGPALSSPPGQMYCLQNQFNQHVVLKVNWLIREEIVKL